MAVNPFLIVVLVVAFIIILGGIFYLMVVFSSPEDKNQAWLAKIITVLSMSLACFIVLLLPFDIANREDPGAFSMFSNGGGGIDVAVMWQVVLWLAVGFTTFVIPFAIFWYEGYDPDKASSIAQLKPALVFSVLSVVIFVIVAVILYFVSGSGAADLDVVHHIVTHTRAVVDGVPTTTVPWIDVNHWDEKTILTLSLSFGLFMPVMLSLFGWVLLIFFGGAGITALPMDLINAFTKRPKPLTGREYATEKRAIATLSQELIQHGQKLEEEQRKISGAMSAKFRRKVNAFKLDVQALENQFKSLEIAWKDGGGSPLIPIFFLLLGIISVILSICWVIQLVACNPRYGCLFDFLNPMFVKLDSVFSLFGVLAYGIFSFYLLWCVFKGCIRVGTKFLLFEIHPMVPNETPMNSFLFNSALILLASTAVVQFCSTTFQGYAANTSADVLFGVYVQSLRYVRVVFNYIQFAFLGIVVLAGAVILLIPGKKRGQTYSMITARPRK